MYTELLKQINNITDENCLHHNNKPANYTVDDKIELTYDDGFEDAVNEVEAECDCNDCNYCDGYFAGLDYLEVYEEQECDNDECDCCDNSEFCQGQYDGKREKERICNCDECNYCRGYNDAMSI